MNATKRGERVPSSSGAVAKLSLGLSCVCHRCIYTYNVGFLSIAIGTAGGPKLLSRKFIVGSWIRRREEGKYQIVWFMNNKSQY